MIGNIKVRISALRKDITIYRLDTDEVREAFIDPDTAFVVPIPQGDEIMDGIIDGAAAPIRYTTSMEHIFEYAKILAVLYITVKDFAERCVPDILKLQPEEAIDVLFEIYEAAVLANPSIDIMTYRIKGEVNYLPLDLQEVVSWLPETVSGAVQRHVYEDAITDDYPGIFETCDECGDVRILEADLTELDTDAPEIALDIDNVRRLPNELSTNVIGQGLASDHLYAVIRRLAVGFRDVNKPPAVLLFAGPTGIGKTLMAKVSCNFLFDSKNKFGRIDCATLAERHDISKLIGAPPGYVGYPTDKNGDPKEADPSSLWKEVSKMGDDGGFLLLDEIEKAHPDIWDVFLTAFDEGYVKTSVGNNVDLRNVVIIMTTNLGSREFAYDMKKAPLGFSREAICMIDDDENSTIKAIKKTAIKALKEYMKPEMIGRITDIVPFNDLDHDELESVVDLEWAKATKYLGKRVGNITIDDSLKERIASISIERGLGARPVARLLEQYAIDAIAEMYVEKPNSLDNVKNAVVTYTGIDSTGCDTVEVTINDKNSFEYIIRQSLTED